MSDRGVTESVVEQAARAWLEGFGWRVVKDTEITPSEPNAERDSLGRAFPIERLCQRTQAASNLSFARLLA